MAGHPRAQSGQLVSEPRRAEELPRGYMTEATGVYEADSPWHGKPTFQINMTRTPPAS